jgi:cytochrome c
MKQLVAGLLVIFFVFGFKSLAVTAEQGSQGTKEEAKAMVLKGEEWFKKYGREKTLAEINLSGTQQKGAFHDRDLYLFAYDFKGVVLAHGSIPKLVGKNLWDLQDADGRYLIQGLIDTVKKGGGWYYYKWPNPVTKKTDDKMAYVAKIDDGLWIGCGVYGKEINK